MALKIGSKVLHAACYVFCDTSSACLVALDAVQPLHVLSDDQDSNIIRDPNFREELRTHNWEYRWASCCLANLLYHLLYS